LRSADLVDVDNHPRITFAGRLIERAGGTTFNGGDVEMTIGGATRTVPLRARYLGGLNTPFWVGDEDKGPVRRIGFEATTTIDRRDFGAPIARTSSAGWASLSTNPAAPARNAGKMRRSPSEEVSSITAAPVSARMRRGEVHAVACRKIGVQQRHLRTGAAGNVQRLGGGGLPHHAHVARPLQQDTKSPRATTPTPARSRRRPLVPSATP
jgi:hypothetical protein